MNGQQVGVRLGALVAYALVVSVVVVVVAGLLAVAAWLIRSVLA